MLQVKTFAFNPLQENTFVLYNENLDCCVIDPGCYFNNEKERLKDFIEQQKLSPKYLLNTHCHLDHVFGNKFVHDNWQLPLYLNEKEVPLLERAPVSGTYYNLPFDNYSGPMHFLTEGDTIKLGNDELKVLFTPGHAPGHICFYCEKQEFIIAGDVLFKLSIGRTDLPGGDYETLINSIREKLFTLPDSVKVYPGHGEATTIGFEKRNNPFLN
jgi:glyoxylase-like metal-dependent hydrolase (beta-lactamase superfamily II)